MPGGPRPGWARCECGRDPTPQLVRVQARGAGPGPLRSRQPWPDTWCLRRPRAWVREAPRPLQPPGRGSGCKPSGEKGGGPKMPARVGDAQRRGRGKGYTGWAPGSCPGRTSLLRTWRIGLCPQGPRRLSRRLCFPKPLGAGRGGALQKPRFPP